MVAQSAQRVQAVRVAQLLPYRLCGIQQSQAEQRQEVMVEAESMSAVR